MNRTFDQLTSIRIVKKNRIESFFRDRVRESQLMSGFGNIYALLNVCPQLDNQTGSTEEINKAPLGKNILPYLSAGGYYKNLYISDTTGKIYIINMKSDEQNIACYNKTEQSSELTQFLNQIRTDKKIYIADFIRTGQHKTPKLIIGSPVYSEKNNIIAIACLEISNDAINSIMLENTAEQGFGLSGESYIVGQDYYMRSQSRFEKESVLKIVVKTEAAKKAFKGISGTVVTNDYRGIEVLSSFDKLNIRNLNWIILSEIDYKEATKPIYNIRINIIFLTVVILISLFGYTYVISNRIIGPIIKLKNATLKVGEGNLNTKVDIKSNDEIGDLSETFNKMTAQLRKQSDELEKERAKRISSVIDGQEMERQRLSREIHDSLGQNMVALKLQLANTEGQDTQKIHEIIRNVQLSFDKTIDEIRRISNDLRPNVLNEFGLVKALYKICEDLEDISGIRVKFIADELPKDIDDKIKIYIFRITQEALSNAFKHANATHISIRLRKTAGQLHLTIKDNGNGFVSKNDINHKGHGLQNITERVLLLNGKFEIYSHGDDGTSLIIVVPLTHETYDNK